MTKILPEYDGTVHHKHATILHMDQTAREIKWKAPEHHYFEKTIEWFLILAVIAFALAFSAFYTGNHLLGILIIVAAVTLAIAATRRPRIIPYSVSVRGIRIGNSFYSFQSLRSYHIDEEHRHGAQLLIVTKYKFTPMLILPLSKDIIDDIESILVERLDEEHHEEPFYNILLEIFRI